MSKFYDIPEESIDDISLLEPGATYSYADYLRWSFEDRVELIKGKVFKMSPAPDRVHQEISGNLFFQIRRFLEKTKCRAYTAPIDVRLPVRRNDPEKEILTVVQPDICVICDESKLDHAGCNGAPDLIVEILSPSSASRDLKNKFELYEENGVKEYWIAYPKDGIVEVFQLEEDGQYGKPLKYLKGDLAASAVLPDLRIDVGEIFKNT